MQLKMWRPAELPLPVYPVPDGFTLRAMQQGEETEWCRCCTGEFGIQEASVAEYEKRMEPPGVRPENVLFICRGGQPVATATAQVRSGNAPYLHYIAVHPDWRGYKLSKPLISAVLHRHAEEGRTGCYLSTDDHRIPAIYTYLTIGYCPVLWSDDARARWEAALAVCKLGAVQAFDMHLRSVPDVTPR